jgi:hypothetical protein
VTIPLTVIFSAVRDPKETCVQNSLLGLIDPNSIKVITSTKYAQSWLDYGCNVQEAIFDSTSKSRIIARKFLLRSGLLRRISRALIRKLKRDFQGVLMPPHNARHFEYVQALKSMNSSDWALLVDSRDLVFQVSPREILNLVNTQVPIHFFLEDGKFFKDGKNQTNGNSLANWNWAFQVLNGDTRVLAKLQDTMIVNSGCILGRVGDLLEILEESCALLANSLFSSFALLDQASLNVIAYTYELGSKVELHQNGEIVLNMCGVVADPVTIKDGRLLIRGKAVPILHQFDRFGSWNGSVGLVCDKREYRVQPSLK